MAYDPSGALLPAAGAPAMWSLDLTTFRGWTPGAQHYYVKIEGPDRTLHVMYEITEADLRHLNPDDGDRVGMETERFGSIDDATAAALVAFAAAAGPDDILVPGGPSEEEWPLVAPEQVMREAAALRERRLLLTWLQALGRYRQWYPGSGRKSQHVTVRRSDGGWTVAEVGGIF